MAKYKLQKSNNVVSCEVLNESDGQYVVRFGNGVIQSVPKNRVFNLDRIDEGVLDTVRSAVNKYGRKIASKVKDVVGKIKGVLTKGFLFFEGDDSVMNVMSPVNTMIGAGTTGKCINFIPGNDVQDCCDYYGIEPNVISNYPLEGEYQGALQMEDLIRMIGRSSNESYKSSSDIIDALFEDKEDEKDIYGEKYQRDLEHSLQLSTNSATVKLDNGDDVVVNLIDYDKEHIINYVTKSYRRALRGSDLFLPLLIFGAPGIGKTAIIRGLQNVAASTAGIDSDRVSVITIGAGNIGPDSFTMPATVKEYVTKPIYTDDTEEDRKRKELHNDAVRRNRKATQDYLQDTGDLSRKIQFETTRIKDLPKTWVPAYDPRDIGAYTEKELDNIANGGWYDDDGHEFVGYGGFLFIDEFVRMTEFGKASIMNLPADRLIGNSLKLGSRWIVICAANRFQDMQQSANTQITMTIEPAVLTRFAIINYVPSIEEWTSWGKQVKSDGEPNVIDEILEYINSDYMRVHTRANPGHYGDFYNMYKADGDVNTIDGEKARACPRTWENASKFLYENYIFEGIELTDVPTKELVDNLAIILGTSVANRFVYWLQMKNKSFTIADARAVLTDGQNAKIELYNQKNKQTIKSTFDTIVLPMLNRALTEVSDVSNETLNNILGFAGKLAALAGDKGTFDLEILEKIHDLVGSKFDQNELGRKDENGHRVYGFEDSFNKMKKAGTLAQLMKMLQQLQSTGEIN